ncbi:unnamed protein product [Cylindrotheca closterium]|uniref:CDC20/Fizzy WD40 domain-containing protein n=1 Tax=Cylindrotheca closterium TaxID=2856 RepID=A0AAD2FZX2_9STRA|nr:unnamed protein product [Cylindrotheca closterium]
MNAELPILPTPFSTSPHRCGSGNSSQSKLLSTPHSNRTPARSTSTKKAHLRRMSPSPRIGRTPVSTAKLTTVECGDRFIPSRRSMNVSLCRRSLFSKEPNDDEARDDKPNSQQHSKLFKKSLLSSLCDYPIEALDDNAEPKSLFRSGNREALSCVPKTRVRLEDPYSHNILGVGFTRSSHGNGMSLQQNPSRNVVSNKAFKILDAPDITDDFYMDHISWNKDNVLAVVLANTVYLYDYVASNSFELATYDQGRADYPSAVSWCNSNDNSRFLAVGTNSSVDIWDTQSGQKHRNLRGHQGRVTSLSWNQHCLTTGGEDSMILHHDLRCANSLVLRCIAHEQKVAGLKWNRDGDMLASGGNDDLMCIWDLRMTSARNGIVEPRLRLREHKSAVKAIDWNPHRRGVLATGGGTKDRTIKIWSSQSGALLSSTDTGSQVSSVIWSQHRNELCSAHGFNDHLVKLWKYGNDATLTKMTDFVGHTSRILSTACSPDGCQVVSVGADESLGFWDVFGESIRRKRSSSSVSSIWGEVSLGDHVIR